MTVILYITHLPKYSIFISALIVDGCVMGYQGG